MDHQMDHRAADLIQPMTTGTKSTGTKSTHTVEAHHAQNTNKLLEHTPGKGQDVSETNP